MRITTILAVFSLLLFIFTASCNPAPPPQSGDGNGEAAVVDEGNGASAEDVTEETTEGMTEEIQEGFTEMNLPADWVEEVKLPTGVHITDYSRTDTSMHAAGYVEAPINRVFTFVEDMKNVLDWDQVREDDWVREGSPRKAYYARPGMALEITIVETDADNTALTMDLTIE